MPPHLVGCRSVPGHHPVTDEGFEIPFFLEVNQPVRPDVVLLACGSDGRHQELMTVPGNLVGPVVLIKGVTVVACGD